MVLQNLALTLLCFSFFSFFPSCYSQSPLCNGILITYNYVTGYPIEPFLAPSDPGQQAYRFESNLTIRNNAAEELKNWRVFVGFNNRELLVSATNVVLADGTSLPADVSNGTIFAGRNDAVDLKTAIETAGDVNQMQVVVELVGTQFGAGAPAVPLPNNVTLANDGYLCPSNPTIQGNQTSICCMPNPNSRTNTTTQEFSPLQTGDLTIMYDVTSTFESNYWAQVKIENHNPFSRVENWNLTWEWTEDEFINSMRGAYPKTVDSTDCIFGLQNTFYRDGIDFSKVLSCERRPTIVDLPLLRANDTNVGLVPFCCRNGTILSPAMDLTRSKSSFLMQVYKMPPHLNKTDLNPPVNWKINSTIGPGYECGQPILVSPSLFLEPTGLPSQVSAVISWQVVCNITRIDTKRPTCCVSFSSFYNDSIIPCNTCACGCDTSSIANTCSANEPSLLLPSEALLVPFDNRTKMANEFAKLKRREIPDPRPCSDNCPFSINWHVLSDFDKGWTARITLFNWGKMNISDWSAAVQLDKAMPGFEQAYSIGGKVMPDANNNTLFLEALNQGLNFLVAQTNGSNPRKNPPVPGTQQSVISFTKKQTPEIEVSRGDGFPTKVYFNGEECSLPSVIPSSGDKTCSSVVFIILYSVLILMAIHL